MFQLKNTPMAPFRLAVRARRLVYSSLAVSFLYTTHGNINVTSHGDFVTTDVTSRDVDVKSLWPFLNPFVMSQCAHLWKVWHLWLICNGSGVISFYPNPNTRNLVDYFFILSLSRQDLDPA